MGLPGYGTAPVDREFDTLPRKARQVPMCRVPSNGISVSDAQFESLLVTFKTLNEIDCREDAGRRR